MAEQYVMRQMNAPNPPPKLLWAVNGLGLHTNDMKHITTTTTRTMLLARRQCEPRCYYSPSHELMAQTWYLKRLLFACTSMLYV
jgi:hypothetical protein